MGAPETAAAEPFSMVWLVGNIPAALMILIFLVMTGLMYTRKISALLALPITAVLFAIVGMVRVLDFFNLIRNTVGVENADQIRYTMTAWFILLGGLLVAKRMQWLSGLWVWVISVVSFFCCFLINLTAVETITSQDKWGELLRCFEMRAILDDVVHKGSLRLYEAYSVAFFGGMLAIFVREKKLAETVIKYAAELAGDRPFVVAVVMMGATSLLFTTLGGLGAIIMVGSIILPIMLSLGLSARVAAGVFLIGVCAGGSLNPGAWALYTGTFKIPVEKVQQMAMLMLLLYLVTGALFIGLSMRGRRRSRRWTWAAAAVPGAPSSTVGGGGGEPPLREQINPLALLTPLLPIALVFKTTTFTDLLEVLAKNPGLWQYIGYLAMLIGFPVIFFFVRARVKDLPAKPGFLALAFGIILAGAGIVMGIFPEGQPREFTDGFARIVAWLGVVARFWDKNIGAWGFIPAFVAGIIYCLVTTWDPKVNNVRVLTKSVIEGAESVMPAVLLMCGIGMLLTAVLNPAVSGYLSPLVGSLTPKSSLMYVVGFGLAAPLALYRGPLNTYGLGLGIATVMLNSGSQSPERLAAMLIVVGAMQGVCDPTNTANVWIANFLGVDVVSLTRFLLPFVWVMVFAGLTLAALFLPGL